MVRRFLSRLALGRKQWLLAVPAALIAAIGLATPVADGVVTESQGVTTTTDPTGTFNGDVARFDGCPPTGGFYTARIQWGDGRDSEGEVREIGAGTSPCHNGPARRFAVSGFHRYAGAGTYEVRTTVIEQTLVPLQTIAYPPIVSRITYTLPRPDPPPAQPPSQPTGPTERSGSGPPAMRFEQRPRRVRRGRPVRFRIRPLARGAARAKAAQAPTQAPTLGKETYFNFGDGSRGDANVAPGLAVKEGEFSSDGAAKHTFRRPGSYTIGAAVKTNDGNGALFAKQVEVEGTKRIEQSTLDPGFVMSPNPVYATRAATFFDTTTREVTGGVDPNNTSAIDFRPGFSPTPGPGLARSSQTKIQIPSKDHRVTWNFGDGKPCDASNPCTSEGGAPIKHTYDKPGKYNVTMLARRGDEKPIILRWTVPVELEPHCGKFKIGRFDAEVSGCLDAYSVGDSALYETDKSVSINGLTLVTYPLTGKLIIDPANGVITASNGTQVWGFLGSTSGGYSLFRQQALQLGKRPAPGALAFDTTVTIPLNAIGLALQRKPTLNGLEVKGGNVVITAKGDLRLDAQVEPPAGFEGTASVSASGAEVAAGKLSGGQKLTLPNLEFGFASLTNASFTTHGNGDTSVGGKLTVGEIAIDAIDSYSFNPPYRTFDDGLSIPSGVWFDQNRSLKAIGAWVDAPIPIVPGVQIESGAFAIDRDPYFAMTGQITVATTGKIPILNVPVATGTGCINIWVSQSAGPPKPRCLAPANSPYTPPEGGETAVRVAGKLTVVSIPFDAGAAFEYHSNGPEIVAGHVTYDIAGQPYLKLRTDASLTIYSLDKWQAEPHVRVCFDIKFIEECTGIHLLISTRGIGGCGPLDVGGWYRWGEGFSSRNLFFFTCGMGKVRNRVGVARHRESFGARPEWAPLGPFGVASQETVKLAGGTDRAMLALEGIGGAPLVRVTGPDGRTFVADGSEASTRQKRAFYVEEGAVRATYLNIDKPKAGNYKVETLPGSPGIRDILTGEEQGRPRILAKVEGEGRDRRLVYRADPQPGQEITFAEEGEDAAGNLGSARASGTAIAAGGRPARGTVPFEPTSGPGGKRKIVAQVSVDGVPVDNVPVATYTAPRPFVPKQPDDVRLRRRGSRIIATWKRVRGAQNYRAIIRLSDGRTIARRLRGDDTTMIVTDTARDVSAKLELTPYAANKRRGPTAEDSVKALKPPPPKRVFL